MRTHDYFVYILTNPQKTVLYVGLTNNLKRRLQEHIANSLDRKNTFTSRYFCYNLIYFEYFDDINAAIAREKQLKKWSRDKKIALIESKNPDWNFLLP